MKDNKNWQYPSTIGWAEFPFSVNGVNFISKLDKSGSIYKKVALVSAEVFNQMNTACVRSVIGNVATMTRDEIILKLNDVNEYAHEAVIELA